jgi:alkylhydroperoxidase family enzyme
MTETTRYKGAEPLVPMIEVEDMSPRMREAAERALKRAGRVPNSARALANAGDLGAAARSFFEEMLVTGSVDRELRLLVRYKVATINNCVYCSTHQLNFLTKGGADQDKLRAIHDYAAHPAFDARERAALAWADALTRDASNIAPEVAADFVAAFSPQERAEITIIAAAMGALNRFNDALKVPIEDAVADIAAVVPTERRVAETATG